MKPPTRVNHPPAVSVPPDNRPLVAPIYQSVKFTFDSVAESERESRGQRDGFQYSRVANPTLRQLELTLAELQGRDACLLTASGVAASNLAMLSLCKQGDHVLMFAETVSADALHDPAHPVALWHRAHDAVDRGHRGYRAHARAAPDAAHHVRVADQSSAEGRRHRAHDCGSTRAWRTHAAGQHVRRLSQPRPVRYRHLRRTA